MTGHKSVLNRQHKAVGKLGTTTTNAKFAMVGESGGICVFMVYDRRSSLLCSVAEGASLNILRFIVVGQQMQKPLIIFLQVRLGRVVHGFIFFSI